MKAFKKTLVFLTLIALVTVCLGLTACGPKANDCEHEFGEWVVTEATCTEDGSRTRTCSKCEETETEPIAHTGHESAGFSCVKCDEILIPFEALLPAPGEVTTVGLELKDVALSVTDDEYPEFDSVQTVELASLIVYLDENGNLCGHGSGTINTYSPYYDLNTTLAVDAFLEGDVVYISTVGNNNNNTTLVKETYVRMSLTEYALGSLEGVEDALVMVETLLPAVETWLVESFLPVFENAKLDTPVTPEEAGQKAIYKLLNTFFTPTETADGSTITLDLSYVRELNKVLGEKTVAEAIDFLVGEGFFSQIELLIPQALAFSVGDFIDFLSVNIGVDIPALLTSLDELAVLIIGSEEATFETLVGIEGNVEDYLENPEFLAMTVKDLVMAMTGVTNEIELITAINDAVGMLKTVSFYTLVEAPVDMKESVEQMTLAIEEMLTLEIHLDKDYKYVDSIFALEFGAGAVSLTSNNEGILLEVDIDGTEITASVIYNYELDKDEAILAEIKGYTENLPSLHPALVGSIGEHVMDIGGVDYAICQPYLYNYTDNADGTFTVEIRADVVAFDGRAPMIITVTPACNSLLEVSCALPSSYATLSYLVPTDVYTENSDDIVYYLLNSELGFSMNEEYADTYSIDFAYSPEDDCVYPEIMCMHFFEIDEENSPDPSTVECGAIYYIAYVCPDCEASYREYAVKEHDYEVTEYVPGTCISEGYTVYKCASCEDSYTEPNVKDYCNDSTSTLELVQDGNTYRGSLVCGSCGATGDVFTYNLYSDLEHSVRETKEGATSFEVHFTIKEAGEYRFHTDFLSGQYQYMYMHMYAGTTQTVTSDDGNIDLTLTLEPGEYHLSLYFGAIGYYDGEYECDFFIEKVEGN
nr:hypothetical protein [Clostridia bacterium]